jgi:hypothetical protein
MKLLIVRSPPVSYYFVPLRLNCIPQHLVLKHPHPQCERPNFHTHINQETKLYYVYFVLYIFGVATWKAVGNQVNNHLSVRLQFSHSKFEIYCNLLYTRALC